MTRQNDSHSWRRTLTLGALALAGAGAVRAQTLVEIEARALRDSPRLAAAAERLEAVRRRAAAAGALADPMLAVESMDLVPGGGRPAETLVTLAQPLPAPGKRGAARALGAAEVAVAEAERFAAERALLRDVRSAYAETWGLQQRRRYEGEAHELVDLLLETATALYGGGVERATAPLEARVMLRRHELDQQETDARWLASQTRLGELLGSREPLLLPRLPQPAEDPFPEFEIAAAAESAPEVRVAARRVELAERALELARLGKRPDWSVSAGSRSMAGEGTEAIFGVGVELPIFRRRRVEPMIAGAEHDLAAARADLESARLAARAELGRLSVERERLTGEIERLREGLLPETSAAFEAARAGLADGSSTISRAADLLNAWIDARRDLARLEAERLATRGAILALLPDAPSAGGKS